MPSLACCNRVGGIEVRLGREGVCRHRQNKGSSGETGGPDLAHNKECHWVQTGSAMSGWCFHKFEDATKVLYSQ